MCKIVCLLGSTDFVLWNLDSRRSRACPAIAQPAWSSVGPASRSSMHGRNTSSTAPAGPGAAGRCRGGRRDVKCFCSDAGLGRPSAGDSGGTAAQTVQRVNRTAPGQHPGQPPGYLENHVASGKAKSALFAHPTKPGSALFLVAEHHGIRRYSHSGFRGVIVAATPTTRTSQNSAVLPFRGVGQCRNDTHPNRPAEMASTAPRLRLVERAAEAARRRRPPVQFPPPLQPAHEAPACSPRVCCCRRICCSFVALALHPPVAVALRRFSVALRRFAVALRRFCNGAPSAFLGAPSVCRGAPSACADPAL